MIDPCQTCVHAPYNSMLTRLGMWGPAAAMIGLTALGLTQTDLPPWAVEMTRLWGPGFLMITVLLSGVAYYVPRETVPHFIQAQKDQAVALSQVAEQVRVMNAQQGKLDEIKTMLGEIRFDQTIIGDRLTRVEERLGHGRDSSDS